MATLRRWHTVFEGAPRSCRRLFAMGVQEEAEAETEEGWGGEDIVRWGQLRTNAQKACG